MPVSWRDVFVTPSWHVSNAWLQSSPRTDPCRVKRRAGSDLPRGGRAPPPTIQPCVSERIDGKGELIVSPLDKVEEPASLVALRTAIAGRLPRVDLPEILLEIAARTDFAARVTDLGVSVCAVLLAEACNTGLEPVAQGLRRLYGSVEADVARGLALRIGPRQPVSVGPFSQPASVLWHPPQLRLPREPLAAIELWRGPARDVDQCSDLPTSELRDIDRVTTGDHRLGQ